MHKPRFVIFGIFLIVTLILSVILPAGSAFVMESEPVPAIFKVLITEVLSNPIGVDDQEWIEVGNLGTVSVDLHSLTLQSGTKKFIPVSAILLPGEHRRFPKTETKLTLANNGGALSLFSGTTLLDSYSYPETAEEVSYGRVANDSSTLRSFCLPTPGRPNDPLLLDPRIDIQSGETEGIESVSLNLGVSVSSGSFVSADCQWNYSDGYTSTSCNPPSHTFHDPGPITVTMTMTTFCNEQILRTLTGAVIADEVEIEKFITPSIENLEPVKDQCVPTSYTGAVINELIPNPKGDDEAGEWIELRNVTSADVDLCGWQLDDAEGGSAIFSLDGFFIPAQSYLVLKRSVSGIALNNDKDSVRLFMPGLPVEHPVPYDEVSYEYSVEGQSYIRTENAEFLWSPSPSENFDNRIRVIIEDEPRENIVVSAVLPVPSSGEQWIEVTNIGEVSKDLRGWVLDNHSGGSEGFTMSGTVLAPAQTERFLQDRTNIVFNKSEDLVQLIRPDGVIHSAFGWSNAEQDRVYRLPVLASQRVPVTISKIIDGETLGVVITNPDDLRLLPPSVRRHWLGSAIQDDPILFIHPLGLQMRAGSFAFLEEVAEGKSAFLEFEENIWNQNGKIQAYVTLESGASLERLLLQNGFASVVETPFIRSTEYGLLEKSEQSVVITKSSESIVASFQKGIVISEIYPSPLTDAEKSDLERTEWVELFNPTQESISLSGWSIDDTAEGGSRAWKFPSSTLIQPGEYFLVTKELSKLALNNSGDDVRLVMPDGVVASSVTYGTVKKGSSVVVFDDALCISATPTAGVENICDEQVVTPPVKKSTSTKKVSSGLKLKYENVVEEIPTEKQETLSPVFESLKQLDQQNIRSSESDSSGFDFLSALLGAAIASFIWYFYPQISKRIRGLATVLRIADMA